MWSCTRSKATDAAPKPCPTLDEALLILLCVRRRPRLTLQREMSAPTLCVLSNLPPARASTMVFVTVELRNVEGSEAATAAAWPLAQQTMSVIEYFSGGWRRS
jgi:hypothetical protein